jgi:hypothetical protein
MGLVESYEAQIATIQDYVVVGRLGGQPVVWFFEKTPVDYPGLGQRDVMRRVPQTEISRRQAAERGMPTPEQTLEGLGAAGAILAQYAGQLPTDQLPAEAQAYVARARFALAALPFALGRIAGDDEEAEAYGDDVFWDPMFLSIMVQHARIASTIETQQGVVEQFVLSSADYDFSGLTDMEVRRITVWCVRDGPTRVPLRMEISAWDGLTPITLTRRWEGRRWVSSMKPAHVVTDILDSGWRASMEIDRILVNHGLPNSAQIARLLQEASGSSNSE